MHNAQALTYDPVSINLFWSFHSPFQLYEESKDTLAKERKEKMSLIDKMTTIEGQLKEKGQVIGE